MITPKSQNFTLLNIRCGLAEKLVYCSVMILQQWGKYGFFEVQSEPGVRPAVKLAKYSWHKSHSKTRLNH